MVPFPPEHAGRSTNSTTRHPRSDHSFPKLWLLSVKNSAPAGRHWSLDLVRITLCGRTYIPEGITLPCEGLAKQTRPTNEKSLQPVVIASFKEELLCPVPCLQVYEKATAKFREDEAAMQLFLAVVPPHQPVSSSTITNG